MSAGTGKRKRAESENAPLEQGGVAAGGSRGLIRLNVGGHVFTTTVGTLTNQGGGRGSDHLLARMFGGEIEPGARDENGNNFIDRDGCQFGVILNYLRDGHVALPVVPQQLQQLRMEAEFYSLQGLVELIDAHETVQAQQAQQQPHSPQGRQQQGSTSHATLPTLDLPNFQAVSRVCLFQHLAELKQTAQGLMDGFLAASCSSGSPSQVCEREAAKLAPLWGAVVAAALQGQVDLLQYVPPPAAASAWSTPRK